MFLPFPDDAAQQCLDVFGVYPKEEQLEVARFIGSCQDAVLIAPSGWGKSLVYSLPAVLWPNRAIVVISPSRALMYEQQGKLQYLGLNSITLDSEANIDRALINDLAGGKYSVTFISPEILFKSDRLGPLWDDDNWKHIVQAVVVEEAHCIETWSDKFWDSYTQLGQLRFKFKHGTAFIALSATLPTRTLNLVKQSLWMDNPRLTNVGNNRPNIRYDVMHLKPGPKLRNLNFLKDLKKTIVYIDSLPEVMRVAAYLQSIVPQSEKSRVAPYHLLLSSGYRSNVMEKFRKGQVKILVSSEATGMGCDISDVIRVVQFGWPPTLLSLVQRLGYAARDPALLGEGIMIVQKSSEQNCKDTSLAEFISTKECRRRHLNKLFGNQEIVNGRCCDNCDTPTRDEISSHMMIVQEVSPVQLSKIPPVKLTEHQRKTVKEKIEEWRTMILYRDYKPRCCLLMDIHVISDEDVDILTASLSKVVGPSSITELIRWAPLHRHLMDELAQFLVELRNTTLAGRVDNICGDQDLAK